MPEWISQRVTAIGILSKRSQKEANCLSTRWPNAPLRLPRSVRHARWMRHASLVASLSASVKHTSAFT